MVCSISLVSFMHWLTACNSRIRSGLRGSGNVYAVHSPILITSEVTLTGEPVRLQTPQYQHLG